MNPYLASFPLLFVITITAIKDAIEDIRRHSSDVKMNSQAALRLNHPWNNINSVFFKQKGYSIVPEYFRKSNIQNKSLAENIKNSNQVDPQNTWKEITWGDIQVGDIILLQNDEPIPADILILSTSEPGCLCYVETKNLDGETNLKIRTGVQETSFIKAESAEILHEFDFRVESESPNPSLYSYSGTLVFSSKTMDLISKHKKSVGETDHKEKNDNADSKIPIDIDKILLRGCVLRNTGWAIGIVLFTGKETKIRLNSGDTPTKLSGIEKEMNNPVYDSYYPLY